MTHVTTLREAATQALEALGARTTIGHEAWQACEDAITALRAALAEPPVDDPHRDHWVSIAEAAQKIAASKECGPMEAKALCAALDRLTEAMLAESEERNFCPRCGKRANGIHTCTPPHEKYFCDTHCTWADHAPGCVRAEPVQEPVAWKDKIYESLYHQNVGDSIPLYTAPPQRKPLTEEEISNIWDGHIVPIFGKNGINPVVFARAIERAHNITE